MDMAMGTIDIHTHILPGVDDGAATPEMSAQLLASLLSQGVHAVVLTPHYYSQREALPDFLERRQEAVSSLAGVGRRVSGMSLYLGSEVYLSEYLFNNSDLSPLCIGGSRYLLVEFCHGADLGKKDLEMLERLGDVYGIRPILAHIERYHHLVQDTRTIDRLLEAGCLLQSNLTAFAHFGSLRRRLVGLIRQQRLHLVGTDCHNMTDRTPQFADNWQKICQLAGSSAELLMQQAAEILAEAEPLYEY